MTEKRYFWIKLQMDFWKSPVVKMLRKPSGGDIICGHLPRDDSIIT